MPVRLTDEEMDVLDGLAAPIAYGRRGEFLEAVASALAGRPESGPGEVYRAAREVQKSFTIEARREAAGDARPRHLAARER